MTDYELYHASTRKHKYIKKIGNRYFYTQQEIAAYLKAKKNNVPQLEVTKGEWDNYTTNDAIKGVGIRDKRGNKYGIMEGVYVGKGKNTLELSRSGINKRYEKSGKVTTKRAGRLSKTDYEDGTIYTLDLGDKKTVKKNAAKEEQEAREYGDTYINYDKRRKARVKSAKNLVKKHTNKASSKVKKQASRGKKALDKWYTKATTPNITVTYDEAKIK